jgi:uncharacterized protein
VHEKRLEQLAGNVATLLRQLLRQSAIVSKAASNSLTVASSNLIESLPEDNDAGYSSVVIEYIVPGQKAWSFRHWHRQLIQSAKSAEGFVRADRHRPLKCEDGALKWYSVIHFDQPQHLNQWLDSESRTIILQAGKGIFETYSFKSFSTGLEGWFSRRSGAESTNLGPPEWKQILSVVLGLYPIIMVQEAIFNRLELFDDWSPASAMWVNLMITSIILTFFVMPFIVKALDFWLQPANRVASIRAEVVGLGMVLASMAVMILLFGLVG